MTTPADRAAVAVREMTAMLPNLTGYVRALTGRRDAVVKIGTVTCTDGKVVYLRPPMALADPKVHDRRLCDRRDGARLRCPACARSEEVYASVYHEVSHITSGSLDRGPVQSLLAGVVDMAEVYGTAAFARWIAAQIPQALARANGPATVHAVAGSISPHLAALTAIADDVRIDRNSFAARAGVEMIAWYQSELILADGIEGADGTRTRWSEQQPASQLAVGLIFRDQEHELEERLATAVAERLAAADLDEIDDEIELTDNGASLRRAVAWLARFNATGHWPIPELDEYQDEQDGHDEQDEQSGEPGDAGDSDSAHDQGQDTSGDAEPGTGGAPGADQAGAGSDADPDPAEPAGDTDVDGNASDGTDGDGAEPGDAAPSDAAGGGADAGERASGDPAAGSPDADPTGADQPNDGAGNGRGDGTPGAAPGAVGAGEPAPVDRDALTDAVDVATGHAQFHALERGDEDHAMPSIEQLESAISQAEHFDAVSATIAGLRVHRPGEGIALDTGAHNRLRRTATAAHLSVDERLLAGPVQRARKAFSNSRLDRHLRSQRKGRIDPSALGNRGWGEDDRVFRRRLRAEGIDYEVVIGMDVSHSTDDGAIYLIKRSAEAMATVLHRIGVPFAVWAHTTTPFISDRMWQEMYPIKQPGEPWGAPARARLGRLYATGGSLDGHNLEFYRKQLAGSRARRKLVLYYTDGEIPATNRREETQLMSREVREYERAGVAILGVGIGTDSPKRFGLDTVRIDTAEDVTTVLRALETRLIRE